MHMLSIPFQLAQIPTPIHRWSLLGLPEEFELYIKRDDLTGAALSGNKVIITLVYPTQSDIEKQLH